MLRPNFFPGQLLDYRDFNRLSEHPEKVLSVLLAQAFPQGGILLGALEEFAVNPDLGLKLRVQPGMALLPSGELLILAEEALVELPRAKKDTVLVVGLTQETVARDLFVDVEDPAIRGFRSCERQPRLVVGTELPSGALEICRVTVSDETHGLRLLENGESWQVPAVLPKGDKAALDTRFRRAFVPLTYAPLGFAELAQVRQALYSMEESQRRLRKIFLVEDTQGVSHHLSQLHAELLALPYQPLKVAYLVAEYAERLALFLESIARKCSDGRANFDREGYHALVMALGALRPRLALPRSLPFAEIVHLSQQLEGLARFAEQRADLLTSVEEALVDLKDQAVAFTDKTTLAGQLFRKVDSLDATQANRVQYQSTRSQTRKLQTRYRNGDSATRTGVFVRDGKISLDLQIPETDSPVIVWFPQYVRRRGAKLEYRINGKPLATETCSDSEADNQWKNRGLVIPPEALVPQGNRLSIRVEDADLDYGFFEAAVYQPVRSQEFA